VQAQRDLRKVYLPATETWVYEMDDDVVGFISMLNNEIGGLFVLPHFQGKGIGSALADFVASKFSVLEVEVFDKNFIGSAFYDKYGFKVVKNYFHNESNELVNRLRL
jgi:putative acetyltransferase